MKKLKDEKTKLKLEENKQLKKIFSWIGGLAILAFFIIMNWSR